MFVQKRVETQKRFDFKAGHQWKAARSLPFVTNSIASKCRGGVRERAPGTAASRGDGAPDPTGRGGLTAATLHWRDLGRLLAALVVGFAEPECVWPHSRVKVPS